MSNWQIIVGLAEKLGVYAFCTLLLAIGLFLIWWAIEIVAGYRQWRKTKAKLDAIFEIDTAEMNAALDRIYEDAMRTIAMEQHPSNKVYDWEEERDAS